MRLFFLSLLISFSSAAQINHSAKELATENIDAYIRQKLFKGAGYQPAAMYELHAIKNSDSLPVGWWIKHTFTIVSATRNRKWGNEKDPSYTFVFFLDGKMEVTKAQQVD